MENIMDATSQRIMAKRIETLKQNNLREIKKAHKGSDLYGVLEKTAFHLHTLKPDERSDKNWFDAQEAMAKYMSDEPYVFEERGSECPARLITHFLKVRANELGRHIRVMSEVDPMFQAIEDNSENDWYFTQSQFGKIIAEYFINHRQIGFGWPSGFDHRHDFCAC